MVFSELPAGSGFRFGRTMIRDYRNGRSVMVESPFVWTKTHLNGLSICTKNTPFLSFDHARHASGSNRYERTHGHRAFFLSSLYKYLNSVDSSWRQVLPGDQVPYAERESGFLSHFTQDELAYLTPYSITTTMPVGYTRTYGSSMTRDVLVGIPSFDQMYNEDRRAGTFGIIFDNPETWILDSDTMSCFVRRGKVRTGGDDVHHVMPVIKIKDDAPVDRDFDGTYVIRVPETEFEGDLAAFLGIEIAA